MIDILKLIDSEKAEKICTTIDKIVALAHLSQSMGNYFARDDSLDPALSIVCQALRGNIDIEYILRKRGGTFQSLTSTYHHLKSPFDRDLEGCTHYPKGRRPRVGGKFESHLRKSPSDPRICWYFQRHGRCLKQDCRFGHYCKKCGSKEHGERSCRSQRGSN